MRLIYVRIDGVVGIIFGPHNFRAIKPSKFMKNEIEYDFLC